MRTFGDGTQAFFSAVGDLAEDYAADTDRKIQGEINNLRAKLIFAEKTTPASVNQAPLIQQSHQVPVSNQHIPRGNRQ